MPTNNIMKDISKYKINKTLISKLEILLRKADNIKYAKGSSIEEENKETMKAAINFVKKTKLENVQ